MEVKLPPDLEAKLAHIATKRSSDPETLARETIAQLVEYDARFVEAVERGRASGRAEDLLEHDVVAERIEKLFLS